MKLSLRSIETTYDQIKLRVEIGDDLNLYKFKYNDLDVFLLEEDGVKSDSYFRRLMEGQNPDFEHLNIIQITIDDGIRPRVYTELRMSKEVIALDRDMAKDMILGIALSRYEKTFD